MSKENSKDQSQMMYAEVKDISPNDFDSWMEFEQHKSPDPFNDFGWFHVTVGIVGDNAGNDFQLCIATPRAVGWVRRAGFVPGVLTDRFDADAVSCAIHKKIKAITGETWQQIVDQLRTFMLWEYEGMV